jgi:uroporphyrinogen-III synthase
MSEIFAIFQDESKKSLIEKLSKIGKIIFLPKPTPCKTNAFAKKLNITSFDWLVLTDVIATELFLEKLKLEGFDFYDLDYLQTCAVGEAVAERLRLNEIHCDIIAPSNKIVDAIANYIQKCDFQDLRFLIITRKSDTSQLKNILCKKGADVTEIQIYEFKINESKNLTMLKTLIKGGAVDKLILTSPHEIVTLKWLFPNDLHQALVETRILAVDEMTFRSLEEEGFNPTYFVWL